MQPVSLWKAASFFSVSLAVTVILVWVYPQDPEPPLAYDVIMIILILLTAGLLSNLFEVLAISGPVGSRAIDEGLRESKLKMGTRLILIIGGLIPVAMSILLLPSHYRDLRVANLLLIAMSIFGLYAIARGILTTVTWDSSRIGFKHHF